MHRARVAMLTCLSLFANAISQSPSLAQGKQPTVAELFNRASPAVVQVVVSDSKGKEISLASGFILSADGKIATNYHVIKDAHSAMAKLSNGALFSVEGVLAADASKDLAILKVDGKGLPFLSLAQNANLRVGDHVVAIGSPLGLEGTASDGIVSSLREKASGGRWIQTTAPVSHGNSGGPLLSMGGSVIGVITWGVDPQAGQNLNFAVPSDELAVLLTKIHEPLSFEAVSGIQQPTQGAGDVSNAASDRVLALSRYKDGSVALGAKQFELAIHDFEESLHLDPENGDAWHDLGLAHFLSDQYEEGLANFREAVKRDPENPYFWRSVGMACAAFKKYDEAVSAYQEAVGIDPGYAPSWYGLGEMYYHLRNFDQAERAYRKATTIDPGDADAWYGLGTTLDAQDRSNDAIAALRRAVELSPENSDAWFRLGFIYDSIGRYEDAVDAWKKESALKPTDASILGNIGGAYVKMNDLKDAEDFLLRAVDAKKAERNLTNADMTKISLYWNELASIYDKQHKHRQAESYWRAARDLQNTYPPTN